METTLKGICNWLEETKGITEIEMGELVEFYPEYVEWLKKDKEEKIYEGWLLEYEDDISILFAESGADRELDFDREREDERLYEMFHTDVNKFLKLIGRQ